MRLYYFETCSKIRGDFGFLYTTGLQLGDSDGISYISPAQLAAYTDGGSQFAAYLGADESANDFDSGANLTPQGAPSFDYTYG